MLTNSLGTFFLPAYLRADKTPLRYIYFYVVANACVLVLVLLLGIGARLYVYQLPLGFGLSARLLALGILGLMRWLGPYRPLTLTAAGSLLVIYDCARTTSMLFSVNINLLYLWRGRLKHVYH